MVIYVWQSKNDIKMNFFLYTLFLFCFQCGLSAQVFESQLYTAEQLEQKGAYEQALNTYSSINTNYPNNERVLCKMVSLQIEIGEMVTDKFKKKAVLLDARKLAENTIQRFPNSAEAHYVMGLSMAKLTNLVAVTEKMAFVKGIKLHAEKAIAIQPNHVLSLYLLGKWHLEICALNAIEKSAINVFMGGLPPATLTNAIANFEKVKKIDSSMLANYIDLAKSYQLNNQLEEAKNVLNSMFTISIISKKDSMYKNQAIKLLETL
jgi:tetratricopeptide (TPR) repeat protein